MVRLLSYRRIFSHHGGDGDGDQEGEVVVEVVGNGPGDGQEIPNNSHYSSISISTNSGEQMVSKGVEKIVEETLSNQNPSTICISSNSNSDGPLNLVPVEKSTTPEESAQLLQFNGYNNNNSKEIPHSDLYKSSNSTSSSTSTSSSSTSNSTSSNSSNSNSKTCSYKQILVNLNSKKLQKSSRCCLLCSSPNFCLIDLSVGGSGDTKMDQKIGKNRRKMWLYLGLLSILIVTLSTVLFLALSPPKGSLKSYKPTPKNNSAELKQISRLSWNLLNRRNGHQSSSNVKKTENSNEVVVLPSSMVYTSNDGNGHNDSKKSSNSSSDGGGKTRSCCRTQKYSQIIQREGCESVTIINRMCFGQCVSVWVPGLFASFPVCRPSKSSVKYVTLNCTEGRRKRRVRVERVRRCSCMELDNSSNLNLENNILYPPNPH